MGLLYNVSAFMRPGQEIEVKSKPATSAEPWPVRIKIGPGGEDTIDIFAGVLDATRLRDALTAALSLRPYDGPLYDNDPRCKHEIVDAPDGGVTCTKCPAWYCA